MPNNTLDNAEYLTAVNTVLEDFIERQIDASKDISPYYADLWLDISRLMRSGGKRLRPQMAVLSYQMFGGKETLSILPAAAALELLHLGTLVHDDIIDRDNVRYGVPNVSGSYMSNYTDFLPNRSDRIHYANSAALLAGDLLLSSAYIMMAESSVDPSKILEVQKLLGRGIFEVIGGELIDTESSFRSAGSIAPETIAIYKTASYSFILPLLMGATLAGATLENRNDVRLFGKNLGIAFQLRDDILGVFGNENETGKSATSDIREGKRTFLIEEFYKNANEQEVQLFESSFGQPNIDDAQADAVRSVLISSGALTKTENLIEHYETQARNALANLTIDHAFDAQLEDLIAIITRRTK